MKKLQLDRTQIGQFGTGSLMQRQEVDKSRLSMMKLFFLGLLSIVGVRLTFLQVVQGADFRDRSDNNRIYLRNIQAARGIIRERNGEALVINKPRWRILVDDNNRLLAEPKMISKEKAEELTAAGKEAEVIHEILRYYPRGSLVSHIVGYVGEADQTDLEQYNYGAGDQVGRYGLEATYDHVLKGVNGTELIEVDALGSLLRRVGEGKAQAGADVQLSIDIRLQEVAQKAMEGVEKGVVIITSPDSGEVLALVSIPSFDANLLASSVEELGKSRGVELAHLFSDENRPMVNRAISGTYPPGSVFKVVPAVAGLETQVLTQDTVVNDVGEIKVDEYRYGNWYYDQYGRTEGEITIRDALKRSNDIFFYKVGEWLGPDRLAAWAEDFGFGSITGIDLHGEVSGLVPNPLWKERARGERWFLGNTYHFAIGQGDLLVTPIQLNQMMGVIANGGRWCKPFLAIKLGDQDQVGVECREMGLLNITVDLVRQGLEAACQSGGTAYPFFNFRLADLGSEFGEEDRVACKTGTAQYSNPDDKTHAWFSVFAPARNPEILVTVLVEGGGEGSEVAAPIAKQILEYWFRSK